MKCYREYMAQVGRHRTFRQLSKKNRRSGKRDHRKLGKLMDLFHFKRKVQSCFLA